MIPVDIHDIHLEEDAASMDHLYDTSVIDYNRAGVPLLELVTEPCLHSAEEAVAFLEHMRSVYKYCDVSEADTKKGQIRCDVNVSIMDEDATEYGTRVEIKNINSFGNVYDAINYEIKRQSELKDAGRYEEVEQETRRFDEESGTTIRMRSKADAIDYKYFVDPNLPKYKITDEWLKVIKDEIPRLKDERKHQYINEFMLSDYDATILVKEKNISDYFETVVANGVPHKEASGWVIGLVLASLNKLDITLEEFFLTADMLASVIKLVIADKLSMDHGKKIIYQAIKEKKDPLTIIEENHLEKINDDTVILNYVLESIEENPEQVRQYIEEGKEYVANFFIGKVMQKSNRQADPKVALELIKTELEKRKK